MATCKECIHYKSCFNMAFRCGYKAEALEGAEVCEDYKNTTDVEEVKHGYWKPTKIPAYFGGVIYECSLCGAKDGDHTKVLGRYCWRCGAKMDGTPKEREDK